MDNESRIKLCTCPAVAGAPHYHVGNRYVTKELVDDCLPLFDALDDAAKGAAIQEMVEIYDANLVRLLTPNCERHPDTPNDFIDGCAQCNEVSEQPRGIMSY